MRLKMERSGQFVVNWLLDAATQCGIPGNNILGYRVEIESSDKHLDSNGFIIDNNKIHQYFTEKYNGVQKFVSCELIAAESCRAFRKMLPHLYSIKVSITGNGGAAWLTAGWVRPKDAAKTAPVLPTAYPAKQPDPKPATKVWSTAPLPSTPTPKKKQAPGVI